MKIQKKIFFFFFFWGGGGGSGEGSGGGGGRVDVIEELKFLRKFTKTKCRGVGWVGGSGWWGGGGSGWM